MNPLKAGLVAGLLAVSSGAMSENLIEILDKAKKADPKLLAAGFEQQAVAETVIQARARLLPGLSYSIEEKSSDQNIVETPNNVFRSGQQDFDTSTNTC